MNLEDLQDKWEDVLSVSDDWTEKNLVQEFLDDLKELQHV